ncbi:hypothetical protein [Chryseobacterium vrystaatense]|uniref:Ig-like domain-containing protein n=1 Tax=Chryseobacterium vrystaatense TaxID=307480 RepID=A0A1M5H3B6_9FLAO|nr:hypothetical protein [Chryseobacterium vrystaatense]SHG10232.1 hypothetical protein SAMN02787073_3557 [Chryseobacterium vrystaatense]
MKIFKNYFLLFTLLCAGILHSQCTVNAGGNTTICGTSYTLSGSAGNSTTGNPIWSLVSKPPGATDPIISNTNILNPVVTGMSSYGNYTFQLYKSCPSGNTTSLITITSPGDISGFTAGPDITNINATLGSASLNGVIPDGYTGQWSAYNIYTWERSSIKTNINSQFSSVTSANTTFSLINKTNHNADPAYVVTLRITSTLNPNCWYEDSAIIRFVPNPQIQPVTNTSRCAANNLDYSILLQTNTPFFSTLTPGSSGNTSYGTTVTMNILSTPSPSATITFVSLSDSRVYLKDINIVGAYIFTLTITNTSGSYTSPQLTYVHLGMSPSAVNFLNPSYPNQMMVYNSSGSGGEVHCDLAGKLTPVTFGFTLNPADPVSLVTTITQDGIIPPGGSPTILISGANTSSRSVTLTPPLSGWSIGTYRYRVTQSSLGGCTTTQLYYVHISDKVRQKVTVDDVYVCNQGNGITTATVTLPAVYKGVINSSYLQDYIAFYNFTLISKPVGSATPTYEPYTNRTISNTSTVIGNLDKPGEYVFKVNPVVNTPPIDINFLNKEYACAGTSMEDTFSIFISTQINSNAGNEQIISCVTSTILNGNDPGTGNTGKWLLVSAPSAATPIILTPSNSISTVTGLSVVGVYKFEWTILSGSLGSCISKSEVTVNVSTCTACYKPAATGTTVQSKHGITSLGRAGAENGNWPMVRNNAWTVLESKTKGFVINRISTTAAIVALSDPVEGMMVYDEQADCLKINTDGTSGGWKCFNTQTCP